MAAANASARGQRTAILASSLNKLTGFDLAVDCLAPRCKGERMFAIAELASFYGRRSTVGEVLRRMRCMAAVSATYGAGGAGVALVRVAARGYRLRPGGWPIGMAWSEC